ncbi:MAG: glucose-1-phosphate adenylyltransferase, partial [Caldicoprobacterales bacterium]
IFAYKFRGYWKDVGTIESYYEANMDLLEENPELDIYDRAFRVFSNLNVLAPQYIGPKAKVINSLVSNDCTVLGEVENSILAPGVFIGEDAVVKDSIILPGARISKRAFVLKAIIGENYRVLPGSIVGNRGIRREPPSQITLLTDTY